RVVREQFEEVDWTDSFDMVFLDGNHSFESVLRDSRIALEISSRPGIIVWHDFNNMLDVNRAIEALGLSKDIVSVRDTWIAFHSTHEESVS
ncbi:MAG: class I SAM-dependent methyltransferase, partial [Planctomycetota bacterium]